MIQLRSQDIVIAVKILQMPHSKWSFESLGETIGIGHNQAHLAFKRLIACNLISHEFRRPIKNNLVEFLVHGVRYVFPPQWVENTCGIPTAASAPIFEGKLVSNEVIVWPAKGYKRLAKGRGLMPIHDSAMSASKSDPKCYDILAAIEAVRSGGAREREVASSVVKDLIVGK